VYITRLRNPASASCISGRQIVMAPVYVVCKQPRIAHRIKADVGLCMTCLNAAHEDWNPLKDGECNGTANNSSAGASNNSQGNPESRGGAESVREDDGRKQPSPQQPRPKQIKLKLRMRTVSTSYLLILMIQHVCCNSCQLNMPLMRC
jgi:hypothetical protein